MQNGSTQDENVFSATEHILKTRNYPRQPAYLLAALEDIASQFGAVPSASKELLLEYFGVESLPDGIGEILRHKYTAKGKTVTVCAGPICIREGSDELAAELSAQTGTSVERRHCLGACDSAPCAEVQDVLITRATSEKVLSETG